MPHNIQTEFLENTLCSKPLIATSTHCVSEGIVTAQIYFSKFKYIQILGTQGLEEINKQIIHNYIVTIVKMWQQHEWQSK